MRPRALGRYSLRVYLAGLVVVFIAAAGAATLYGGTQAERDAREAARRAVDFSAGTAARELEQSLSALRRSVASTAAAPGITKAFTEPGGCSLAFGGDGAFRSGHLDILRPGGSVACSSSPLSHFDGYGTSGWAGRAMSGPVVEGPLKDARTGRWAILAGAPIPGGGAVVGFLDVHDVGRELTARYGGARRLEFLIVNPASETVVSRSVEPGRWTGAALRGTPFAADRGAAGERRDLDGARRIYGKARVESSGWLVYAGAGLEAALAPAQQLNRRERSIILGGLVLMGLATYLVYRRIALPIRRLSAHARAAAGSDAPEPLCATGPAEVVALAEDFNTLVAALERELAERVAAEKAAHASAHNYRLLFEGSPVPKFVYDSETLEFLEVNGAAVQQYGYSREEFLSMRASDVVHADALADLVQMAAEGEDQERTGPWHHIRKDGSLIEVEATAHPVDFGGRRARFVTAEDVTDRERLERHLQQSQRLESLGQLAGGVAHDFNNLLSVILNYAAFVEEELAQAAGEEGGERWRAAAADIAEIRIAGERGAGLTRQLLAFARREVVRRQILRLDGVIGRVEQLLRRTLGEHVELTTNLEPGSWPILADPGQLEQVLLNLAVNARDAMPDGGSLAIDTDNVIVDEDYASGRPQLTPGRYVRLRVSDTGVGMPREVQARAFEPFFTTKPAGEGTGLGLATTYGIVTQSGGSAQIYSEPGIGTTFTALFPASADAEALPEPTIAPRRRRGSETVLVVEDEQALLEMAGRILERNGYVALLAQDGASALEIAAGHDGEIEVLLTDMVMPKMLGTEVARKLREVRPCVRVLYMSGYARGVLSPIEGLAADAMVLDKPFSERDLLDALGRTLDEPPGDRPR